MTFFDRIKENSSKLTEADQRLIEAVLGNTAEAAFLSGVELAKRVDLHEASATRLAQKLGYRGYPEMRAELQRGLLDSHDAAARMRRSVSRVSRGDFLADLIDGEISALEGLKQCLSQKDIDLAADRIAAASRVFLFGQGHAQSVMHFLQRRLDRFGMTTIALEGRGRDIAEKLVSLNKGDVLVAFAFRKQPESYAPLIEHCRTVRAATILISDLVGPTMNPQPDLMLAAPRGRSGSEFQTPTIPLAIVSGILLTIAGRHEKKVIGVLEQLSELFESFEP